MRQRLFKCKRGEECLTVTYCGTDTKILLSNIEYLESNLRKVIFALSGNREIEVVGKLTDYEDFLLSHGFCRCHKSYIVNIEHIDSIDSDVFCLTGGKKIKISRTYLQSAKKAYFDYVISNIPENDKSKMLIVGDSQSSDILGGINADIDTCWYNPEGLKAKYPSKYTIASLEELMSILKKNIGAFKRLR